MEQVAVRPGRETNDNIYILRRLMERTIKEEGIH